MSDQPLSTAPNTLPAYALRVPPFPYTRQWESEAAWQAAYDEHSAQVAAHSNWWKYPTVAQASASIEHALQSRVVQADMFDALRGDSARTTYVAACEAMVPALVASCPSLPLGPSKKQAYPQHTLSQVSVIAIEKVWWPCSDKAIGRVRSINRLRSPYAATTNTYTHYDRVQRGLDALGRYYWRGKEEQEPEMRLLRCLLIMESCRPWTRTPGPIVARPHTQHRVSVSA